MIIIVIVALLLIGIFAFNMTRNKEEKKEVNSESQHEDDVIEDSETDYTDIKTSDDTFSSIDDSLNNLD